MIPSQSAEDPIYRPATPHVGRFGRFGNRPPYAGPQRIPSQVPGPQPGGPQIGPHAGGGL